MGYKIWDMKIDYKARKSMISKGLISFLVRAKKELGSIEALKRLGEPFP